ncbi:MAG: LytTR family DNA-binding domain-containing protein [Clostridiales bacterium]|jgi:DNA-binding LytR/AlgR family response regulator|nr:LytTR family DNA-binding domain-containing protein [Clostridiales bacterium]
MNIVICDKDKMFSEELEDKILKFLMSESSIKIFSCSKELIASIMNCKYDIIILSIYKPASNGFEIARLIRRIDSKAIIVFAAIAQKQVSDNVEFLADGYLIKPIDDVNLEKTLRYAVELKRRFDGNGALTAKLKGGGTIHLRFEDIIYIESSIHYLKVSTRRAVQEYHGKISEAARDLSNKGFAQSHRSFLVNMAYIWCISSTEIKLINEDVLPVGRTYSKQLNERYRSFKKGE